VERDGKDIFKGIKLVSRNVLQKREMKHQTLPTNWRFVDYSDNGIQENWFYNDQILEVGGAEGGSISEDTAITECAETCDSTGICPISSNQETAPLLAESERERKEDQNH
jgi:hypothetical protein